MDRTSSKLSEVSESSRSSLESIKEVNRTAVATPAPLKDMKVFMHHTGKNAKSKQKKKKLKLNRNQIMIRNNMISPLLKRQVNNSGKSLHADHFLVLKSKNKSKRNRRTIFSNEINKRKFKSLSPDLPQSGFSKNMRLNTMFKK